jgi:PAS domain S-box-containing protein
LKLVSLILLGIILVFSVTPILADSAVTIKVGVCENPPKIFTDSHGVVSGLWPDIINYIADKENWKIQWVHGTWAECLVKLQTHEIDLLPGMAYTADRAAIYDFSQEPIYIGWSRVYARQGIDIRSVLDLSGKKIAILQGGVNVEGTDGIKAIIAAFHIDCTLIPADSYTGVFAMLDNKQADAGVVSEDAAHTIQGSYDVVETPVIFQPTTLYFALAKGNEVNSVLIPAIDKDIKEIRADTNSVYYKSIQKWLGALTIVKGGSPIWLKWLLIGIAAFGLVAVGFIILLRYQVKKKTLELQEHHNKRIDAEKALFTSEERFHDVLEAMPDVVSIYNNDLKIVYCNDATRQFTGQPITDFIGHRDEEAQPPEVYNTYLSTLKEAFRTGEIKVIDTILPLPKTGHHFVVITFIPMKDEKGEVKQVLFIAHDISSRKETEQKFRDSEERFRRVLENNPDIITLYDTELRYKYINSAVRHTTGIPAASFIGRLDEEVLPPEVYSTYKPALREVLQTGIVNSFETSIMSPYSGFHNVQISYIPLRDEKGNVKEILGIMHDVTKRKHMEERLKDSEERFRRVLENIPDIVALYDRDLRIQYLNGDTGQLIGYETSHYIGRKVEEVWPPEIYTTILPALEETLRTSKPSVVETDVSIPEVGRRILQITCIPILDKNGGVKEILGITHDITKPKLAELKIKESEEKLRLILESVPHGLAVTDTAGIILQANPVMVKLTGYSAEELQNMPCWYLFIESDQNRLMCDREETIKNDASGTYTYTLKRKDGSECLVEINRAVVKDESGKAIGVVSVLQDLTERRLAEEEHRKNVEYVELDKLKANLLSTVSHELRTPLAGIKGYTTMLLTYHKQIKKAEEWETLKTIDQSADRLMELIEHLLDMSRLDAGLLRLNLQPVKPRDILIKAIEEARLRSPDHTFIQDIRPRLPAITADARRLRQIIDNLVDNAVKYSEEGTEVTLRAEVKENALQISVTDQGRGIPEAEIPKLFERFYRITEKLKKDPGGFGLGLSLCKALVEAHGGRIWLESDIGKGSTFYFTIPLVRKAADKSRQATFHGMSAGS